MPIVPVNDPEIDRVPIIPPDRPVQSTGIEGKTPG